MNLKEIVWNEKSYDEFISYLKSLGENKLIEFNKRLIFTNREFIGIKTPDLRKYAKEILKGDGIGFLKICKKDYYDEVMIRGFVIASLKEDVEKLIPLIQNHILYIDNWALCDSFSSSLKIVNKHRSEFWKYIKKWLKSKNLWEIRFGLVMMMDYYMISEYIDDVLKLCDGVVSDEYYVKMAKAWLVSVAYIKFRDKTLEYINTSNMDDWTHNKAIQKIIESNRVSLEEKAMIRKLKK